MNIDFPLVMVQALLAMMLVWSCFCRLVKTDLGTERELRWVIVFEGMAAGLVLLAPWLPLLMAADMHWQAGTTPAAIWLLLLLAATLMQLVKAKFWKDGRAPAEFQRGRWLEVSAVLLALALLTPTSAIAAARATVVTQEVSYLVLKNSENGHELRLLDTACSHAGTLAQLRPEYREAFKDARILDKRGTVLFYGCWIQEDDQAFVLLEDGAGLALPIGSFRDPTV